MVSANLSAEDIPDHHLQHEKKSNVFGGSLEVGAFAFIEQNAYKGTHSNYELYPLIRYEKENLTLAFPTSKYEIELSDYFSLIPKIAYRFEGYKDSDSVYLNGMTAPKPTAEAGLALEYINPNFTINFEGMADILNRHKGSSILLDISKNFHAKDWLFRPYTGVEVYSDNFVDYYYGVSPSEIKPDRPAYQGEATGIYFIGLLTLKPVSKKVTLFSYISNEWFGAGVKNSPITDRTQRFRIFLGFSYLI
jgi:MipA family protein